VIEEAGTVIEDMGDGPSPNRVLPIVWKLDRLKALSNLNCNMSVLEWTIASDNKIKFNTVANSFSNSYTVLIVQ
jgi:hypothetical protein